MRPSIHRSARAAIVIAALGLALVGCASDPSPSTGTSAAPIASSAPTVSSAPTAPTETLDVPSPTPAASPSASVAGCAIEPQTGALPSDRMVEVRIDATTQAGGSGGWDRVTFVFDDASLPGPAGIPTGRLEAAEPPYTEGASGLPLDVDGDHVAFVRFDHMSLSNDVGQPTYDGPFEFEPDLPALRHVVLSEMFEGVIGWYVGYDGPGCATLTSDLGSVTLTIPHD